MKKIIATNKLVGKIIDGFVDSKNNGQSGGVMGGRPKHKVAAQASKLQEQQTQLSEFTGVKGEGGWK